MTTPIDDATLSRRTLLRLGGGAVVVVGLGACDRSASVGGTPADSSPPGDGTGAATTLPSAGPAPATTVPATVPAFGGKRLVLVQLNGGNDLLNSLPPTDGRYRDLRPTLAIPEAEVVGLTGLADAGLHPSLAPLGALWDVGGLALVRGIGFEVPNRSHFVSMDRWWTADELSAAGWVGRVLDGVPGRPSPLFATALGAGAPVLVGRTAQPTVITSPGSFRWVDLQPEWIAGLAVTEGAGTSPDGDLRAAAREAFQRTLRAVADFADITGGSETADDLPEREGGATIADGLAVAAQLLTSDVGAQVVVVSAGGFDTHANQLPVHAGLLADLAAGLVTFQAAIDAAGLTDEVLLVATSEFGRRAGENGSGGCDHGAGGLALALGGQVRGGIYGDIDLGDLLDGDVRPTVAPQALFTRCLDWLGADAAQVLGARDDALDLLR
ncbi:MAG: DUF1501 domain-containing protein [Actinomycetota bacterium]|nr:DUF1501 domain-containing protein [Actinomycetota bacterium]